MRRLKCGDNFGITYTCDKIICSFILEKDATLELFVAINEALLKFSEEVGVESPEPIRISKVLADCLSIGYYVEQRIFDIPNSLYNIDACARHIIELYNFYNKSSTLPTYVH